MISAKTDMEGAFLKAGLVSEKELREKRAKEEREKKTALEKIRKEKLKKRKCADKEKREIEKGIQTFNKGWEDSETHHILVELLKEFTPFAVASFAWKDEQLGPSKRCCVCDKKLVSKEHLLKKSHEIAMGGVEMIRKELSGEISGPEERAQELRKVVGDVMGAVVSPHTKLMLCNICFSDFRNWVMVALFTGVIDGKMLGKGVQDET